MAGKANTEEDDLFKLAAQGGGTEAATGLSDVGVLFGAEPGREEVTDLGYSTRVKAPTKDAPKKPGTTERAKLPRGTNVEKQAADIAETLEEKFAVIFGLLSGVAPVTGVYGVENSPKAIRALLDIGKRRPAVMRALMTVANGADGLEIGKFIMGIVMALQVDFGRMRGDELPAQVFGVTEIINNIMVDNEAPPENNNVMGQTVNGQRFEPVS